MNAALRPRSVAVRHSALMILKTHPHSGAWGNDMSTLTRHFIIFCLIMVVFALGLLAAVEHNSHAKHYRSGFLTLNCGQGTASACHPAR